MLKSTADVTAGSIGSGEEHPASAHKHEGARVVHDEQEREAYRRNESAAEGFRSGRGYHIGASMTFLKLEET
ncbi:hypothetical protein CHH83_00445 [Bacillus sp. 7586-K]|nr:hypothetical protein CHH83_00445 [Bacillus sp. 7586-K]